LVGGAGVGAQIVVGVAAGRVVASGGEDYGRDCRAAGVERAIDAQDNAAVIRGLDDLAGTDGKRRARADRDRGRHPVDDVRVVPRVVGRDDAAVEGDAVDTVVGQRHAADGGRRSQIHADGGGAIVLEGVPREGGTGPVDAHTGTAGLLEDAIGQGDA